jgi:hypothetical protein
LKITFYDRKIKELLENIERKDQVIDKYKLQKTDYDQKHKFYEDKLEKLADEN